MCQAQADVGAEGHLSHAGGAGQEKVTGHGRWARTGDRLQKT